jgi:hypothetical protein
VRRFPGRFAGERLEVALQATTGWRFLVEELRAAGAVVHLAEPAETAALGGNKKRAKSDRADARHHRELLLAGRLPESWIPPDHILDLRSAVHCGRTAGGNSRASQTLPMAKTTMNAGPAQMQNNCAVRLILSRSR